MVRVATYQAEAVLDILPGARDVGDHTVITACTRVREGWLLGRRVDRVDLAVVMAFA